MPIIQTSTPITPAKSPARIAAERREEVRSKAAALIGLINQGFSQLGDTFNKSHALLWDDAHPEEILAALAQSGEAVIPGMLRLSGIAETALEAALPGCTAESVAKRKPEILAALQAS